MPLRDDCSRFATRFHVGGFRLFTLRFAFGFPHGIFGEGAQLDVDEGLLAVARNQLLRQFRLVSQALLDFGKSRFVCRDFFGHYLRDFHALFGAEHVFQIDNRSCLAVGIREAIAQFVRKLAQKLQVVRRQDGMVAFDQHAHEIVVTESFLELVRFDKHRVALDKVAVPRGLDVDFFHAHDRNCKQNDKRRQHNGAVCEQKFAKTAESLVDFFNVNLW